MDGRSKTCKPCWIPPHKGTKGYMKANETSFKKGHKPWHAGTKGKRIKPPNSGSLKPGAGSRFWKGGRLQKSNGYIWIFQGNNTYKQEHRLVVEKALGRPLETLEEVHHINGIKHDNRNCNLLVCSKKYHKWLHMKLSDLYIREKWANQ